MKQAVAYLAFSHDVNVELKAVEQELRDLQDIFRGVAQQCLPYIDWKVRQDVIEQTFQTLGHQICIFHFSGHAGPNLLQLNQDDFTPKFTFAESFAALMSSLSRGGLRLVFLNGCSTGDQAAFFLGKGVPAVIATEKPILDSLAYNFACRFYRLFTNPYERPPLQKAFQDALLSFTSAHGPLVRNGQLNEDHIADKVRGNFKLRADETAEHYQLFINPATPDIAQQTFADWMATAATGITISLTPPDQAVSMGKSPDGYVLCNRVPEADTFEHTCREKMRGQRPEPVFFFYHDQHLDCPHLMPLRYQRFLLPTLCRRTTFYQEMKLPAPLDFGPGDPADDQNPQRDRFKIRLSELYKEAFGGADAVDHRLAQPLRRPPDERLLVVHHALQPQEWVDRANRPAQTDLLQRKAWALFDWYIGTYAGDLQTAFSERLVVLITARYLRPDGYFPQFFAELEAKYGPQRVVNVPDLLDIDVSDLDAWQEDFLGDKQRVFLDAPAIFAELGAADTLQLPLQRLIGRLQQEITRFNQSRYHAAG